MKTRKIPNEECISTYIHCGLCLEEMPRSMSPRNYQRIQAGFTPLGIQIWCVRHDCNIMHIDFQGKSPFPANTTRKANNESSGAHKNTLQ